MSVGWQCLWLHYFFDNAMLLPSRSKIFPLHPNNKSVFHLPLSSFHCCDMNTGKVTMQVICYSRIVPRFSNTVMILRECLHTFSEKKTVIRPFMLFQWCRLKESKSYLHFHLHSLSPSAGRWWNPNPTTPLSGWSSSSHPKPQIHPVSINCFINTNWWVFTVFYCHIHEIFIIYWV